MRWLRVLPVPLFTIVLLWALHHSFPKVPGLGRFLDPVHGCWAAAEPTQKNWTQLTQLKGLQEPVEIWLEDRMVPHLKARNDHDLYFAEGYIHATMRLWQMDLQTRAAGGRISELLGAKALKFDRAQRRKGMVYGAENSLRAMEADPRSKEMLDAYRDGVNAYIHSLSYRDYPIEYKLMDFAPEDWTNLRSALLLKYMADDLTGHSDDIEYSLLRDQLGQKDFDFLFPDKVEGSKPVIPAGTTFDPPSLSTPQQPGDSVWAHFKPASKIAGRFSGHDESKEALLPGQETDQGARAGIGSNNWAISGKFTASGSPLLCNDPHLGLNLPSLWFEIQLQSPGLNAYGVSLPGAPGIVIGFNDHIAWGVTNNYRDVKDYYEISPAGKTTYWFNGKETAYKIRVEQIAIKGANTFSDTVRYTVHGPIEFEPAFPDPDTIGRQLAMSWMAHRGTNELLALYLLNRANDYNGFVAAISHFECPAQNFVYADNSGNIAMWGQGQFVNKWKGQGKYVMEGKDSATLWGQNIPMNENPHVLNPPQGYVASANQSVTDSTYPYWYNGDFVEWRSWEINEQFNHPAFKANGGFAGELIGNTPDDLTMVSVQNSSYSLLDSRLLNVINRFVPNDFISGDAFGQGEHTKVLLNAQSKDATKIQVFWSMLYKNIWEDDFPRYQYPSSERTIQLLLSDSASKYYDDRRTPEVEDLAAIVRRSVTQTDDSLKKLQKANGLEWYKVKNTSLTHLAKLPAFSYDQLEIGGWRNTINATTHDHGPSWRMIVSMGKDVAARAVYPGGQSGNPGSVHYGDFIEHWVKGNYYELQFVKAAVSKNPFRYTWTLQPEKQ